MGIAGRRSLWDWAMPVAWLVGPVSQSVNAVTGLFDDSNGVESVNVIGFSLGTLLAAATMFVMGRWLRSDLPRRRTRSREPRSDMELERPATQTASAQPGRKGARDGQCRCPARRYGAGRETYGVTQSWIAALVAAVAATAAVHVTLKAKSRRG